MGDCCDIVPSSGGRGPAGPPGTAGVSALTWGCDSLAAAADTRYLPPGHEFAVAPVTDTMGIPITSNATLRKLFVRHNATGGNGNNVVYTVLVNGVATALATTLATGAIGQASNLVNTVAVLQGDVVSLRATKAAVIGGGNISVQASLEVA